MFLREAVYVPLAYVRQFGGRASLRRHQLRQINRMLAYASAEVPYYRDRPGYRRVLTDLADLATLPLVTKLIMRATPQEEFLAPGIDPKTCHDYVTSGTTGHRIAVRHDGANHDYHMAASVRRFLATRRYNPTNRLAQIKPFPMPPRKVEKINIFRRYVILSTLPVRGWIDELLAYRPHALIGYPVHLRELLRSMTPDEIAVIRRSLRMVMSESELLVPAQRAALTAGFGVPVFDDYAAYEILNISYECSHGGRHIAEDRVYVEIIDDEGRPVPDGVEGQIVATAYQERAMPLIRYAMGDIGRVEVEPCGCGRRFRTLTLTSGRAIDVIVLPDGSRLYGDLFMAVSLVMPGLSEMFVRQDADGLVHAYIVPDGSVPVDVLTRDVTEMLTERAGREFPLDVSVTDRIPLTPGGKGKVVESLYAPAQLVNQAGA